MKTFRVSLALKISCNFEIKVKAKSKKEALEKAIEKYDQGDYDEDNFSDVDWSNQELDIKENSKNIDEAGNGIFIEETK